MVRSSGSAVLLVLFLIGCGGSPSDQGAWDLEVKPNPASSRASLDLVATVDGVAEFSLRGSTVAWRQLVGSAPENSGSTASESLPEHVPDALEIRQLSGRNRFELVERPSLENDWAVVVKIEDPEDGQDEYHVQLSWRKDGANLTASVSPVLLEQCHREVQRRFQRNFPQAAFAWDPHNIRPAGVLAYLQGEATAAREDFRMRVSWECFVDPRRQSVREADYAVLSQETP